MKVKDLIQKKDYDHVEVYLTLPGGDSALLGMAKSKEGKLFPLDDDTCEDIEEDTGYEEVISYKEFASPEKGIQSGLIITVQGEWT